LDERRRLREGAQALIRQSKSCLSKESAPVPELDEPSLRAALALLRELETLLADPTVELTPEGVSVVAAVVLGDDWSPLYFPRRSPQLPVAVAAALAGFHAS